ncbi:MAG: alpha/beta hydrolase [Opitutaceae bacterium]|nr:alpha/beta hydrolase [Opitutaceae bacterium]
MPGPPSSVAEVVVLLHGIAMPALELHRVARALGIAGYRVANLPYPSRAFTLERLALDYLPAQLHARGVEAAPRLHFVAHSMGGIIVRLHLQEHHPANLGRVVLLAPPNAGTPVADRLSRFALCRWLLGPNLSRLGTATPDALLSSRAPGLVPPDYEVGIIVGNASINPVFSRWLAGANDGAVSVDSARLPGAHGFLVVPHSHTGMLWRKAVVAQVLAFLRTGRFAE